MHQRIILTTVIIVLLAVTNVYTALKYLDVQNQLRAANALVAAQKFNLQVLNFNRLFIEKVLNADQEVDFQTRLQLENDVRNLKDEEILSSWQKFTESKTEISAQEEAKNLLEILTSKI